MAYSVVGTAPPERRGAARGAAWRASVRTCCCSLARPTNSPTPAMVPTRAPISAGTMTVRCCGLRASSAHQALFLSRAFVARLLLFCFPFFSFCACGPISHHFLSGWPTGPYSFLSFFFRPLRPICFCLTFLSLFFNFFFLCLLLGLPTVGLLLPKTEINSH